MTKKFKQISTGLTLVCENTDVIAQYEKYPDFYLPLEDKATETKEKSTEKK